MKILCLIPPAELDEKGVPDRLYGCSYGYDYKPPIHLLLCATVAKNSGHDVRFLDCVAEGYNTRKSTQFIEGNKFDYVLFFTVYVSIESDLLAASMIGKKHSDTRFVFFGAAPTWKPEQFLTSPNCLVIRGEPEETLMELLSEDGSERYDRIDGLSYMENGKVFHNRARCFVDLDTLPMPDRRLLLGSYRVNRLNVYPVTAACFSRGCAYKCKFCAPMAVDQAIELEFKKGMEVYNKRPPLRLRSTEKVIEEFREIRDLGYRGVEVSDNEFSWGKKRTLEICEGIKDLGLEWICLNRAPAMHDDDVVQALGKAGCKMVYMGTESFNQEILDDCEKKIKVGDIKIAVDNLRKHGIEPEVSVLMGASPRETRDTVLHSVNEALKLRTRFLHFGVITPFPNSEYYDELKKNDWIRNGDYSPIDMLKEPLVDLPQISGKEMMRLMKRAYIKQYLSPMGIVQQIRKIRSVGDLFHKLKIFFKFLKFLRA